MLTDCVGPVVKEEGKLPVSHRDHRHPLTTYLWTRNVRDLSERSLSPAVGIFWGTLAAPTRLEGGEGYVESMYPRQRTPCEYEIKATRVATLTQPDSGSC